MSTINQSGLAEFGSGPMIPRIVTEWQFDEWIIASEGVRAEWVDGEIQMMSPANFEHQTLNVWLLRLLGDFVEGKSFGGIVGFDFMMRLRGGKSRRVPDIFYVAEERRALIKSTYLDGPPDIAIEIVSQDSQARDWREKFLEYEATGVREYWIVDPFSQRTEAYCLVEDAAVAEDTVAERKFAKIAEVDGRIASTVLEGFAMRNEWLWATPRPTVASLLKELGLS